MDLILLCIHDTIESSVRSYFLVVQLAALPALNNLSPTEEEGERFGVRMSIFGKSCHPVGLYSRRNKRPTRQKAMDRRKEFFPGDTALKQKKRPTDAFQGVTALDSELI